MRLRYWLLGFLASWLLCAAALAQPAPDSLAQQKSHSKATPAPQWALDRFKLCWDALKEDSLPERVYQICWRDLLQSGNIAPFKDVLQEWAMDGVRPGKHALHRYHSLQLLGRFRNDTTQAALRSLITHRDSLQVSAAQTLIKWGDWEYAAPVLESRGMYEDLAYDQRAIPVLYRALQSSDLVRRLTAAEVLYTKLQKADSLHYVVRQVLALPPFERTAAVTKRAVDLIARDAGTADLEALTHVVVTDTGRWAKLSAFSAITTIAFTGDSVALAQLQTIRQTCPDAEIRERAYGYVKAARARARANAILDSTGTTKQRQP